LTSGAATVDGLLAGRMTVAVVALGEGEPLGASPGVAAGLDATGGAQAAIARLRLASTRVIHLT